MTDPVTRTVLSAAVALGLLASAATASEDDKNRTKIAATTTTIEPVEANRAPTNRNADRFSRELRAAGLDGRMADVQTKYLRPHQVR